ncbi:GntR family transcriptional regulator [Pseudonocardia acaciae]|uniref:GntR family transcriptional regulator n=1 Tax=Pseudonocardia acaciae TaxID=551276 RepID=UPI000B0EA56F|nr:GntR family transcriptional regulator [Pseudonocardia acaciae]
MSTESERSLAGLAPAGAAVLGRLLGVDDRADSRVGVIVAEVARDIIEGRLAPGADLNSVELAKRFESSRTPVREALMVLEKEGLVTIPARRRPRVAVLELARVEEVYRLRGELYAMVSERVAERADAAQLAALDDVVARMDASVRAGDVTGSFWHNVTFHERAGDVAGDLTLKRTLDSLGVAVLRLRHHSLSQPGRPELSLQDHRRLVRAYRERDARLAGALSRSIVISALGAIKAAPGPLALVVADA